MKKKKRGRQPLDRGKIKGKKWQKKEKRKKKLHVINVGSDQWSF